VISFVSDVLDLIDKGQDLYGWLRDKRTRELTAGAESGRSVPDVYAELRAIYADMDVLVGPDGPFPMAVFGLVNEAIEEPEAVKGDIEPRPRELSVYEHRVIEAIKRRGSDIWPGDTFALKRVNLNQDGLVAGFDAYIGNYYAQVCSANYLEYELLAAIKRGEVPTLPERAKIINQFGSTQACLLNGGGVEATLGISTLVVYKREGEYWMLCEVRSTRVAEYGALYHVAPSFIFQPVVALSPRNLLVEWSIRHNVYREYLEEIFNVQEVQFPQNNISPKYFYADRNLNFLRSLEAAGSARLWGTAFAFNLLNHRPELLTLLIIEDEAWYEQQATIGGAASQGMRHLCLNNEFSSVRGGTADNNLQSISTLPLSSRDWARVLKPWSMVPPAAPALVLGTRQACEQLGINEPEWLQPFEIR